MISNHNFNYKFIIKRYTPEATLFFTGREWTSDMRDAYLYNQERRAQYDIDHLALNDGENQIIEIVKIKVVN